MYNNKYVELFIDHVRLECEKNGVEYRREHAPFIELTESIKCSGFFSDGKDSQSTHPVLCFADQREDWLEVLTHEYCHMTQWLEGDKFPLWEVCSSDMESLDLWLSGKDFENIELAIDNCRDLELDNEKRTVEAIKKWNLPIDISKYTKKSNAYVHFYNYLKTTRKWSVPGNAPYQNENILNAMSENFDMEYSYLTEDLKKLYAFERI
jgi:hypothetical protein